MYYTPGYLSETGVVLNFRSPNGSKQEQRRVYLTYLNSRQ